MSPMQYIFSLKWQTSLLDWRILVLSSFSVITTGNWALTHYFYFNRLASSPKAWLQDVWFHQSDEKQFFKSVLMRLSESTHPEKSDNPHKQLPSQWRSVCFVTARRIASANPLNNSLSFSTYCRWELMSIEEKDELIKMQKATRYKVRMRLSAVLAQISRPLRLRQAGKLPVRMWPVSQTEKATNCWGRHRDEPFPPCDLVLIFRDGNTVSWGKSRSL